MEDFIIDLPTSLDEINQNDDNIDVLIHYKGSSYVLIVATPQNMKTLMKREGLPYLPAGCPMAFVEKLTYENIWAVVKSFCEEDAYWLKYYHLAGEDS